MKKIMKRLLTGVLTLATVFTTLPVTQVHAADSVYTTTDGKAGTIVKIDNGGSEVSSFEESIMNADGQIAYCIDINTNFQSGYKNRINATERMSDDQISDLLFYAYVITSLYFTVPVDFLTGIEKRIAWFMSSYHVYKTKKGTA